MRTICRDPQAVIYNPHPLPLTSLSLSLVTSQSHVNSVATLCIRITGSEKRGCTTRMQYCITDHDQELPYILMQRHFSTLCNALYDITVNIIWCSLQTCYNVCIYIAATVHYTVSY